MIQTFEPNCVLIREPRRCHLWVSFVVFIPENQQINKKTTKEKLTYRRGLRHFGAASVLIWAVPVPYA